LVVGNAALRITSNGGRIILPILRCMARIDCCPATKSYKGKRQTNTLKVKIMMLQLEMISYNSHKKRCIDVLLQLCRIKRKKYGHCGMSLEHCIT
jgi:hypothetical protein